MISSEKKYLIGGLVAGLLLAGVVVMIFGRRRDVPRDVASAQSQVAPAPEQPMAGGAQQVAGSNIDDPGGLASIELTDEEQRTIGLRTAEVTRRQITREIRSVGRVEPAETQLTSVSARIGGRVDRLFVDFTGQPVRRGQPIALLYSPEVVSTAEEYKLALETRRKLSTSPHPSAVSQADDLVQSSRRRLQLWGLTDKQIEEISPGTEPQIHITVYSPASGIVTERKVTEGQYVKEGDALYTVTDLRCVWVIADIYEVDMRALREGQRVEITSQALPGVKLSGRVSFVDPMVKAETRTVPVRIEVPNPGLRLRPGMYVEAVVRSGRDEVLAVPRSAVLQTGKRALVYVSKGNGVFEGRAVELGPAAEEYFPVQAGLEPGERVVTNGAFMIDSQTRITGGMTGLFGGSKAFGGDASAPAPSQQAGTVTVKFRTEPDPPKGAAENLFVVEVLGPDGKPVSDAQVKVALVMPAMPSMGMPEMRSAYELSWNGRAYTGNANISMAGPWNVTVSVERGGTALARHRTRLDAR